MIQKIQRAWKMRASKQGQKGAVVIEGILSLTIFMMFMVTMLFLIQVAYIQSRMSVAVCTATKQVAGYAHLYYATGLNENMTGSGGKSSEIAAGVGSFISSLGSKLGSISDDLGQTVTGAGDALADDSIADYLKSAAGEALVRHYMEENLKTGGAESADEFYRMYSIKNVSTMQSKVLEGESRDLFIGITYEIRITKFFNEDVGTIKLGNWAYATVWGSAAEKEGGGEAGEGGGEGGSGESGGGSGGGDG